MQHGTSKIDSSRRMPCIRNGDMLKNRLSRLFRSYCRPKVGTFISRADNFHRVPIVGQFLAAVEANYICTCQGGCLGATRTRPERHRKAKAGMPTAENRIEQSCEHMPSNGELVSALGTSPESLFVEVYPQEKEGAPSRRPATPRSAPAAKKYSCGIAACA